MVGYRGPLGNILTIAQHTSCGAAQSQTSSHTNDPTYKRGAAGSSTFTPTLCGHSDIWPLCTDDNPSHAAMQSQGIQSAAEWVHNHTTNHRLNLCPTSYSSSTPKLPRSSSNLHHLPATCQRSGCCQLPAHKPLDNWLCQTTMDTPTLLNSLLQGVCRNKHTPIQQT